MNPAEKKIVKMIYRIRRRWLARLSGSMTAAAVGALFAWALVMVLLDNMVMLNRAALVAGWALLGVGAVAGLAAGLYRLTLGRPDPVRLALLYERRVPDQHNRLVNAVQLIIDRRHRDDPFAGAVVLENAAALSAESAGRAVDFQPLRYVLAATGLCMVMLLGYSAARPMWVANALQRLFHPLSPPAHLLATDPVSLTADATIIEGRPFDVTARLRSDLPEARHPDKVTIEYRVGALGWSTEAMQRQGRRYLHTFEAVWHPMDYRIRAGRSVSPIYHVAIRYRPRVEKLALTITPPPYAGTRARPLKPGVGDVAALIGSTVQVDLTANTSLKAARLELPERMSSTLKVDPARPTHATGRFQVTTSGSYTIRLTDAHDLTNLNPPRYTITAEPDTAPVAIITRPGRNLVLAANAVLDVELQAEDDIGLAHVGLEVRTAAGQWTEAQGFDLATPGIRSQRFNSQLALAPYHLKVNEVLLYRVTATDHCQPQANVGVGRTWSITIAEPDADRSMLVAQARRLLEALEKLLAMQKTNRQEVSMDRPVAPIVGRQQRIRELTLTTIDHQRQSLRPTQSVIDALVKLADGPMLTANRLLGEYTGPYEQRAAKKPAVLEPMDRIIEVLESLIGQVSRHLAQAEQAEQALAQLPPQDREQALKTLRDMLEKLRQFKTEQDQVIADTEELVRKGKNLTDAELAKIEQLKGTEDKWAEVFNDSVKDITKLTEQLDTSGKIHNDYKEMVEQIEEASKNLNPPLVELAVPREQAGREMAETLAEEMEMWLPSSPDHIKWMMEEPLETPEIPMVELPDQLSDLIGDLIEDQDELNDAAEDQTSAWADSIAKGAGWEVAGGPISNFSAVGKTGNQLPDNNELSGRSGDGRSGRSQGQLVENVAKGLSGRKTPTRITNDPYEKGVVKELQQMATGGATGGGKARGAGQEGLQGQSPPPLFEDMKYMADWQKRIRQKAQRVAGQLQMVRMNLPDMAKIIAQMKEAENAADDGRYGEMFNHQRMILRNLEMARDLVARQQALRVDKAYAMPADQRVRIHDAPEEPVPGEYRQAVRRYFDQLSETP